MTYEKELRKKDDKIVLPEGMTVVLDERPTAYKDLEAICAQLRKISGVKQVLYRYKEEAK